MEERDRFIRDVQQGLYSMTELRERYGIGRKSQLKVAMPAPKNTNRAVQSISAHSM